MKTVLLTSCFIVFSSCYPAQITSCRKVEPGVSYELAQLRKNTLGDIKYELNLDIPENKTERISGTENITFSYKKHSELSLQIDFKENTESLLSVAVNGQNIKPVLDQEHILVDQKYLKSGLNQIAFKFLAGNSALNRRDGYLYTLFVPDRARTMFPCFDQPNLKSTYSLTLTIPEKWNAMANGKLKETSVKQVRKTLSFAQSDLLPTYLFFLPQEILKNLERK